ncbi:CFS_G0023980.mRNA.1.CDS.1 [Saccharomyces cerevisiae]|nr:CFS_G0023980.mRNA.1.CDS.1 [Saccharomyces cerevisiae]CAI7331405.1 CFS_G0023980.mRNA.1.CDS.1 [Saccharomyces cerevisiae]
MDIYHTSHHFWMLSVMIIFTIPETYKPMLLIRKAKRLRKEKNDQRYYAVLEVTPNRLPYFHNLSLNQKDPLACYFETE